jgi:hypothetical protein
MKPKKPKSTKPQVELILISEAFERLGMKRDAFQALRKNLGIPRLGYRVNWPTVIQRIEESQNKT